MTRFDPDQTLGQEEQVREWVTAFLNEHAPAIGIPKALPAVLRVVVRTDEHEQHAFNRAVNIAVTIHGQIAKTGRVHIVARDLDVRPGSDGLDPEDQIQLELLPAALVHRGGEGRLSMLIADQLSAMDGLDRTDRYVQMLRVAKLQEECGEAAAAIIAYHHVNPRKEAGALDDVVKELADVALTAKVGLENFGFDADAVVAERERAVLDRLRAKAEQVKPPASPLPGGGGDVR